VILRLPSLKKDARNTHGGYNYVSIDDYYKEVARVAAEEGIHWHPRETANPSLEQIQMKQVQTVIKFTYGFDIYYAPTDEKYEDYFTCSIYHPFQGAQSSGSAMSYAEKLFMRTVFKVQTGEGDADAAPLLDSESDLLADMGPSTAPVTKTLKHEPGPVVTGQHSIDVAALTNMVIDFCASCRTVTELQKYWDDNVSAINLVQGQDRKGYMEILNTFKTRKNQLTEA